MIDRWWHPRRRIVAALEGRLAPRERARLERHLAGCSACRAERDRLAAVMRLLEADSIEGAPPPLPPLPSPASDRGRGARGPGAGWLVLATAAIVVAAGVAAFRFAGEDRIEVVAATDRPAPFESIALAEHRASVDGSATLECRATTAAGLRGWLKAIGGFHADLIDRPRQATTSTAGTEPSIEFVGGWRSRADAPRGAVISARIDGRPATLLVGHAADVTGIPEWNLLGKQLQVRHDAARGEHLLSWRNAGKAYTLVTDPETPPQLACRLCHDAPRRLATIEQVAGEL